MPACRREVGPKNGRELLAAFDEIGKQLRSQYTITYTPTNKERVQRFREIRIETRRKGLEVHHRPGYYARAEAPKTTSEQ